MQRDIPPFFSFSFHRDFLPALLRERLRAGRRNSGSPLSEHMAEGVPIEFTILTIVALAVAFWGMVAVIDKGMVGGWFLLIAGGGGFLMLLVNSINSGRDFRPSPESFRPAAFLFFLILGLTAGALPASLGHAVSTRVAMTAAGIILGYLLGALAGLWIKRLGWMSTLLEAMALPTIIGMIVVDLVLIFG
ncbi:MAG: hypothetical protein PHY31_02600 [Smithellaceae bacterium]|nr:hypothetical protein [Smithellaceae bacterium]